MLKFERTKKYGLINRTIPAMVLNYGDYDNWVTPGILRARTYTHERKIYNNTIMRYHKDNYNASIRDYIDKRDEYHAGSDVRKFLDYGVYNVDFAKMNYNDRINTAARCTGLSVGQITQMANYTRRQLYAKKRDKTKTVTAPLPFIHGILAELFVGMTFLRVYTGTYVDHFTKCIVHTNRKKTPPPVRTIPPGDESPYYIDTDSEESDYGDFE